MTVDIEPKKECSTCSVLCMRVDLIAEKVERQERLLDELQKKIITMEVRLATILSAVVIVSTIIGNLIK